MKKVIGITAAMVMAIVAFASSGEGDKVTYEIDKKASKVYWTGKKVSGEHTGYISIQDGELHLKNEKLVSAVIKIDMNSIVCTDLSGEWADKLVGHLKNDDFFSADRYPTSIFEISSLDNGEVKGNLTIKGITHDLSFPAEISVDGKEFRASGIATIDRTKYDIKYGSGKFFSDLGDRMIDDEFQIKFDLKATKTATLSSN